MTLLSLFFQASAGTGNFSFIIMIIIIVIVIFFALKMRKRETETHIFADQTNKVVNVTLDGGIIGLLANSPQGALNDKIRAENAKGWKVIQVIPADSGNLFLIIFRFILLIITVFLYTTANGYYVIMERKQSGDLSTAAKLIEGEIHCSNCDKEFSSSMKGSFCQECGKKL